LVVGVARLDVVAGGTVIDGRGEVDAGCRDGEEGWFKEHCKGWKEGGFPGKMLLLRWKVSAVTFFPGGLFPGRDFGTRETRKLRGSIRSARDCYSHETESSNQMIMPCPGYQGEASYLGGIAIRQASLEDRRVMMASFARGRGRGRERRKVALGNPI